MPFFLANIANFRKFAKQWGVIMWLGGCICRKILRYLHETFIRAIRQKSEHMGCLLGAKPLNHMIDSILTFIVKVIILLTYVGMLVMPFYLIGSFAREFWLDGKRARKRREILNQNTREKQT